MGAINYQVVNIDLATIRNAPGEAILGVGVEYDAVVVQSLPPGAAVSLAFGDNKPPVPLTIPGQSFEFQDNCGHPYLVTESLRVTNPIGAGVVVLIVSTGGVRASST